jgi:nucleotide-binding universal stress UspA family protein
MARKTKPVVVLPLDGSEISTRALGAALAVTEIIGGTLHVVHVTEVESAPQDLRAHLGLKGLGRRNIVLHQLRGDVVDGVLDLAEEKEARIIVMSGHGETYNQRHLAGSTALAIMQKATIPILVIRSGMRQVPTPEWRPKKILAPLDGSPEATEAMDDVFHLARELGSSVDVLHIAMLGKEPPAGAGTYTGPRYLDYPQYDWPSWSEEFIRRCYAPHEGELQMRLFHREGDPVEVVNDFAAENAEEMIALSWHGHLQKRIATTVKGILRRAELPVLLIRSR